MKFKDSTEYLKRRVNSLEVRMRLQEQLYKSKMAKLSHDLAEGRKNNVRNWIKTAELFITKVVIKLPVAVSSIITILKLIKKI